MKKCLHCGRLGIFFYLDTDGLCEKCAVKEKEHRHEADLSSAREFVNKISRLFKDIEKNGAKVPSSDSAVSWRYTNNVPHDCVEHLRENCQTICAELPKWREYPRFPEVFLAGCIQDHFNYYFHVAIPLGLLYGNNELPVDFSTKIYDLLKRVDLLDTALRRYGAYEHRIYRIVGSSYDNEDGTSRQSILSKIKRGAKPFQDTPTISLKKYKYQEEDAVAVYANDQQVGNISRSDLASSLLERWERYDSVVGFEIKGSSSPYGMEIEVRFIKEH